MADGVTAVLFCVFPLDGLDVLCLEALGALGDRELYRLAFLQAAESV